MVSFLLVIALGLGIPASVVFLVWFIGREYDRHPWFARMLDANASLYVPRQADPRDSLPQEYVDQVPGWDDRP